MTQAPTADSANPLLATQGLPRFPEIRPDQVVPAIEAVVLKMGADLAAVEDTLTAQDPTWENLVAPFMRLGDELEYAWSPVGHLLAVCNSDELREAYEQAQPLVVEASLKIGQSRPIYDGLVKLRDSDAFKSYSEAQQRTIQLYIRNAEHAGVGLDGQDKERFVELQRELSQLALTFNNNVLDATKAFEMIVTEAADAEGWPRTLRQITAQSFNQNKQGDTPEATPEAGPWRVTLDPPCFTAFMQHSRNRTQRGEVFRAFTTRAAGDPFDNSDVVEKVIALSRESAQLLGHATYAELSLSSKMAPGVEAVQKMFDELAEAARPVAAREFEELQRHAAEHGQTEPLAHWDVGFWAERLREQRFGFTDDELRPYFPLPRVLDGLFGLCTRLFGVTFEPVDDEATIWQEEVRYYRVLNEAGEPIASFYLDPYSRPAEKRGGAWMNDCLNRRRDETGLRLAVVHLCCNGTPPVGDTPSLMSFREVETLFHEFGHGLQGMLTTQDLHSISGISGVEWDAVELASQFMENWCYEKPVLVGMTQHVETGDPLPDDLFEKIVAARTFMSGYATMRQLTFGMTDMELYHRYQPGGTETANEVAQRIEAQTSQLSPLPEARKLCSFSHIFGGGYAAGYYSYKWSEVLSADAFAAFEEAGLSDDAKVRELGRRYRDTVLALGGGRHPMDVFKDFRGREPETEALLRHSGLLNTAS